MSAAVIKQSIEALYQEAEAAVHDGQPMLTIIQSFPPQADVTHLSVVGDIVPAVGDTSSDVLAAEVETSAKTAMWRRIDDLLTEAETVSAPTDHDAPPGEHASGHAGDDARDAGDAVSDAADEQGVTTAPAMQDPTPAPEASAPEASAPVETAPAETTSAETAPAKATPVASAPTIPAEPPAPDYVDGAATLDETDVTTLVDEAKAEAGIADTPLHPQAAVAATTAMPDTPADYDDEDDDIDSVMADIAAAVTGVDPASAKSQSAKSSGGTAASKKSVDEPVSQETVAQEPGTQDTGTQAIAPGAIISNDLAAFIGNTVRAVLAEELPTMVKQAVTDALADAPAKTGTPKKAADTKTTGTKTTGTKTTGTKTAGKKPTAAKAKAKVTAKATAKPKAKSKAKAASATSRKKPSGAA